MTNTFKTLITASALVVLSGTTFAGETSSTTFKYGSSAPLEATYERFEKIAEQACKISLRDAGSIVVKTRMENKCRVEMVGDAVKASKTGDTSSTTFTYDSSAPMEVTYERFEKVAEQACQISLRDAGSIVAKTRLENKCRAEMLEDAIKATETNVLVAYHKQKLEQNT